MYWICIIFVLYLYLLYKVCINIKNGGYSPYVLDYDDIF